jgi:hypothetical protein
MEVKQARRHNNNNGNSSSSLPAIRTNKFNFFLYELLAYTPRPAVEYVEHSLFFVSRRNPSVSDVGMCESEAKQVFRKAIAAAIT